MSRATLTIDCTNIRKEYRRGGSVATVLRGVDLRVRQGECIVLAGPSGSGKTTLLAILGCTLRADEGTVRILGRDVGDLDAASLAVVRRDRIGFLFQRFHLIRGLSAVENVAVPLLLAGVKEREAKRRAAERLSEVGLGEFLKSDPRRMSVGQCQRVALARAIVNQPDLILADEPTASLDAASGQAAMQLIRRIVDEENRTAVIVTHDTSIFQYADRVLELRGGTLIEKLPGADLRGAEDDAERKPAFSTEGSEKRTQPGIAEDLWPLFGGGLAGRYHRLTRDN